MYIINVTVVIIFSRSKEYEYTHIISIKNLIQKG
ncbi:hypothetical protein SAMN06296427_10282 [Moheibacter sediminis]|uniref:Uncharacterized protein n=1 Tax=Moheibacter sediminis TaxID=1434700 RepID=A0A1W1Z0N1_9FLAO|nr:hypothetical protein SAMN06296427_10282 [Moheibacter sediminis]